LVEVAAAGLNGADLAQRNGLYPPPPGTPAEIPGLEVAGVVIDVGEGVRDFGVGDRVMAVVPGAGQAERIAVHERTAMAVPAGLSLVEAGGLPEAFTTAHDALFTQCRLQMGERVLVHGAAGGVGTAAVQLASAAGASVIGTVRHAQLRAEVAALGPCIEAVGTNEDEFADRGPFDVILELVGAVNLRPNLDALAPGGRISVIGVGAGAEVSLDLYLLMGKRARLMGSTLRTRPLEEKAAVARALEAHALPLFESGRLRVPVAATFGLDEAGAAYARFAEGGKFGKVVIEM
jgi:NADPH:quinone reductase-like Zn-dependent oxidoreductase